MLELNRVHCIDALDGLRGLPDGSVLNANLVKFLASFPQGITLLNIFITETLIGNLAGSSVSIRKIPIPGDFGAVFPASGLQGAKNQNGFSRNFLYTHIRQENTQDNFGLFVRCLVAIKRPSVVAVGFFFVIPSTQTICEKLYGRFVHHSHLDYCVITGRDASCAFIGFVLLDSDVSFAVNKSRKICNISFFHSEFLQKRLWCMLLQSEVCVK